MTGEDVLTVDNAHLEASEVGPLTMRISRRPALLRTLMALDRDEVQI
jgi:hypothetical protein